ncbi:hypothetical protein A6A06_14485 [Streptomyces sp. CB02923]|uniref:polyketide synthase n=1 Tax=Streptomyces sp. CB02923 TaxID=1718985 RepID=UPI00093C035B|nr:polyketide synthase [Streptomyces sp. CB02923]OKI02262.1 hypothetical protein A6A06_14485 [Streptomyces sp. CB02923]
MFREPDGPADAAGSPAGEPIALVGMACRVSGADDLIEFAALLDRGEVRFGPVPEDRFPGLDVSALRMTDKPLVRAALLHRIDEFDAAFFGIRNRMAVAMDPAQRILLELTWQALEHAAIPPDRLAGGDTGVYVAAGGYDFRERVAAAGIRDGYTGVGNLLSFNANRISQQFDLRGPSITVDTACAGGLTAVALAVSELRSGTCDTAVAGSSNILCAALNEAAYFQSGMLSPRGRCVPFSADADGYVRGEGGAVFILRRLADARRDGDPVQAVIRGAAVRHGGRTKTMTSPSLSAQTAVISRAWRDSGLSPRAMGYLEAHGTATPAGDPLEIAAVRQVTGRDDGAAPADGGDAQDPLWVSSAKANVGHLEAAAGCIGLVKAVLTLRSGRVFPIPGLHEINPGLELAGSSVALADRPVDWAAAGGRRLAGVNAFGISGSVAHVVVESWAADGAESGGEAAGTAPVALALSATGDGTLRRSAALLARQLPGAALTEVAAALGSGRHHLDRRAVVLARRVDEAREAFEALSEGRSHPALSDPAEPHPDLSPASAEWLSGGTSAWPPDPEPARTRAALVTCPFDRHRFWIPGEPELKDAPPPDDGPR